MKTCNGPLVFVKTGVTSRQLDDYLTFVIVKLKHEGHQGHV